jgi:predicted nucleic acid-binding protein
MTIIWGLKVSGARRGNPKQPGLSDLRFRARVLLEMLEEEGQAILFSTVSLAEVLVRVDEKMHEQFIATVQQKFYCPPFNLPASALAAKLWLSHRKLAPEDQVTRATLKADVQIIATAAVHGAKRFYTHDKKARKLAEIAGMEELDLPTRHPDMNVDAKFAKNSPKKRPMKRTTRKNDPSRRMTLPSSGAAKNSPKNP